MQTTRRLGVNSIAAFLLLALAPAVSAGPQDPARVDGTSAYDPASSSARPMRSVAPSPSPSPAPTMAPARDERSLAEQWSALTTVTPEQYRRAYGDPQILQRFSTSEAPSASAAAGVPQQEIPGLDPRAMQQASDEFARTLKPVLQKLRQDVDTELRRGSP